MTRREQQQDEVTWASHLFRLLPGALEPSLQPQDPPEPDVVAGMQDGAIGIELREVVAVTGAYAQESEHANILTEANTLLGQRTNAKVQVSVAFSREWLPRKNERRERARELADLVEQAMPEDMSGTCLGASLPGCLDIAQPPFDYISIFRSDELPQSYWTAAYFWWGGPAAAALIQKLLDAKWGRRKKYQNKYRECWLLLHRSGSSPSSGYDIGDELKTHSFTSDFDRVFLLSGLGPELIELALADHTLGKDAV